MMVGKPFVGIDSWLESLGLGQYAALFKAHDIDREVLPSLTAEDLREIGVGTVGHRRKLLTAISGFGRDDDVEPGERPALPFVPSDAERRHMTVLFCDLVL